MKYRHTLVWFEEAIVELLDEVGTLLKLQALWGLVGVAMWLRLALLGFRAQKPRWLLEGDAV